jgi:hypothetical protein
MAATFDACRRRRQVTRTMLVSCDEMARRVFVPRDDFARRDEEIGIAAANARL